MADRTEAMLFLIDVQVRGDNALRKLNADLAAAREEHVRQLVALNEAYDAATRSPPGPADRTIIAAPAGGNQPQELRTNIVGVRGPKDAGSRMNPIIQAQESGQAAGLGNLAAAVGDSGTYDRPSASDAAAYAAQQAALLSALQQVARVRSAAGQRTLVTGPGGEQGSFADAMMAARAAQAVAPSRPAVAAQPSQAELLMAAEVADRLGVHPSTVYAAIHSGVFPGARQTGGFAPAWGNTTRWQIPENELAAAIAQAGGERALANVLVAGAGGGGGGGGGGRVAIGAGGGGGGGNGFNWQRLLWGAGLLGLAGFGTVGSFAGLGPEHLLMTGLGIAGSAGTALGGAGLLGLGAAGAFGVGAGSDLGVMKSTITDTQTLSKDLTALSQATAVYGKNSQQAHQAAAQLNADIAALGNTAGVKAELGLAKAGQALDHQFDLMSSHARVLTVQILDQGLQLAQTFLPLVIQTAQRNLAIIDNDIKPLFSWLKGPEGIQIWQDLENVFAHNLPAAIGAFTNGIEFTLRLTDIAAQYTGGFTQKLDDLFKRLNSLSNVQINNTVSRLVGDFKVWEQFVKALIVDIARLFSNDVGTGRSIIVTLTQMLQKVGQWEQSVAGRQSLMTIFTVHKAEIQELLKVIPLLINGFAPVYMTLAPALTKAFTTVAGAIIDVVKAIESIPGGTWLVGLTLIAAKVGALGNLMGALTGRGAAGAAARGAGGSALAGAAGGAAGGLLARIAGTGVGSVIQGGLETGALGLAGAAEGAGFAGLAGAITAAGAAVAPVAAGLLPLIAAAGGIYGLVQLFGLFSNSNQAKTSYTGNQLAQLLQQKGTGALSQAATPGSKPVVVAGGRAGEQVIQPTTIGQVGSTQAAKQALDAWAKSASNAGDVAHMSAGKLEEMVREGDALAQIFPKDAPLIDKFTNKLKSDLAPLQGVIKTMTARWNADGASGLKTLTDVFDSNTRLIAHVVGLNSAQGEQLMHQNVQKMVTDIADGMFTGKIDVTAGMAAIKQVLDQGMKDNATNFETRWKDMFQVVTALYATHKINTQQFLSQLESMEQQANKQIANDTEASYKQLYSNLKGQYQDGLITKQQFDQKTHQAQLAANAQQQQDLSAWIANLQGTMKGAGALTAQGMQLITKETNEALGLFGASKLPIPAAIAWNNFQLSGGAGQNSGKPGNQALAIGGKVNHPMFLAGEEAPAHPEWVIASNPAYRGRNLQYWREAGRALGVRGYATGGYVFPFPGGTTWERIDEGQDASMPVGSPIGAIGPATVKGTIPGWFQGQPLIYEQLTGGPRAGSYVYLAEQINRLATAGSRLMGNNALAYFAPSGTGIEMGWAGPSGEPLAHPYYQEGQVTGPGTDFHNFLLGLAHGVIVAGGGARGGGMGMPAWTNILAPRVRGSGALATTVRSALSKIAAAANAYGRRHAGAMTVAGGGTHGLAGNLVQIVGQLINRFHWSGQQGDWLDVINAESGGSMTAQNPHSSAYGIAQFINGPGEYAKYGGNVNTMAGQLLAMANYIRQRYGDPANAWAHEQAFHWYRTGGKVGYAGAFAKGGMASASGPTMAVFGENGPETAIFIPGFAAGGKITGSSNQQPSSSGPLKIISVTIEKETNATVEAITRTLKAITNAFNKLTNQAQATSTIAGALAGLNTGTSLSSLGLKGSALKALGISPATARALIGTTNDPTVAGFLALAKIADKQVDDAKTEQRKLEADYKRALKDHNKKLEKSILGELNAVDQEIITGTATAQQAMQQAIAQAITNTITNFTNQISALGDTSSTLAAIQALTGGENLSSLGLTPAILATLGLSGAQSQVGAGLSVYQTLASNQNGALTAAQLAQAAAGVNASNAGITAEEQPIEQELAYYQSILPGATGANRASIVSAMQQLAQQLLGLQSTIDSNNTSLQALTQATTQNTQATTNNTGAMTGTVAFSYQGQYYPASLSSDDSTNTGVGL